MKTKKKTISTVEKQPQNKPKTIKTNDGKEFKVMDFLLMKYSLLFKNLIEDEKS
jgi:tRNA A58 N-methylase Trm61